MESAHERGQKIVVPRGQHGGVASQFLNFLGETSRIIIGDGEVDV